MADQYLSSFCLLAVFAGNTQQSIFSCLLNNQTKLLQLHDFFFFQRISFRSDCFSFALSKSVINPYNLRNVISTSELNVIRVKWANPSVMECVSEMALGCKGNTAERREGIQKKNKQFALIVL